MPTVVAEKTKISALCVAFIGPVVELFLVKNEDWSATRLGREALKDPGKIGMLRKGTQLRPETARKLIATMEKAAPGFCQMALRSLKVLEND